MLKFYSLIQYLSPEEKSNQQQPHSECSPGARTHVAAGEDELGMVRQVNAMPAVGSR